MIWGQDFSEINVNGQSLGHDTQKVISEKVENYRTSYCNLYRALRPVFGQTYLIFTFVFTRFTMIFDFIWLGST